MGVKAILLAGGRSVRMGRDKAALTLAGETLLERHARQLRSVGVEDMVAVCNADNRAWIGVPSILQRGDGMSGAILTGLEACAGCEGCWLVCVNDIVADADYRQVAAVALGAYEMAIPTHRIERAFHGGRLEVDPASRLIRSIVEKPPGGCPPGAAANVMIHRLGGAPAVDAVREALVRGMEYESAINWLIGRGLRAFTTPIERWIAIKTPEDYERAKLQ